MGRDEAGRGATDRGSAGEEGARKGTGPRLQRASHQAAPASHFPPAAGKPPRTPAQPGRVFFSGANLGIPKCNVGTFLEILFRFVLKLGLRVGARLSVLVPEDLPKFREEFKGNVKPPGRGGIRIHGSNDEAPVVYLAEGHPTNGSRALPLVPGTSPTRPAGRPWLDRRRGA